ncbi:MAG: LON peptidase substrate-binding domain-containing protein [Gemmatimonadaceae bacterium]
MSRVIPLFPLPLVLFPKAVQPLHIFEPRYRQMLVDCLAADREFGIICRPAGTGEKEIAAGTIGCVARVESTQPLGDGRSNIMVMGTERFAFVEFAETGAPYYSAVVENVTDLPIPTEVLEPMAARVRDVFLRAGRAARAMQDDAAPLPELPSDPGEMSFAVAQYLDLDLTARQQLLSSRGPDERLQQLEVTLTPLIAGLEQGALVHERAKANGHGHGPLAGET